MDIGYTGDSYPVDLSGVNEYGGGPGVSPEGVNVKSTWCMYMYIGGDV